MAETTPNTVDAALAKLKDVPAVSDDDVDTAYAPNKSWTQIAAEHAKSGLTYSD